MRATGESVAGERGFNGDGACAMVRPFDNEGRRGGERRALDERVYTFVCIHQGIRRRLAGGKRVYGGPGRFSVQGGQTMVSSFPGQRFGSDRFVQHKRFSELGMKIGELCEPAEEYLGKRKACIVCRKDCERALVSSRGL